LDLLSFKKGLHMWLAGCPLNAVYALAGAPSKKFVAKPMLLPALLLAFRPAWMPEAADTVYFMGSIKFFCLTRYELGY